MDEKLIIYPHSKHPALGGCFGAGCLVSYGADFVNDGSGKPDCSGHGTHVAGIIAAQKNKFGFTGAAPDVTLGNYKVNGCEAGGSSDVMIAAFNQAYEDGSDIITCSISASSGWPEDPWSVAIQRIVEAGVPCTLAAGNGGGAGLFQSHAGANGKRVTAIASVDNTETPILLTNASYTTENSSVVPLGWVPGQPKNWGNISLPLWATQNSITDPPGDCNPLPPDTPDLSKYLVLVLDSECGAGTKIQNAADHGARLILVASRDEEVYSAITYVLGIDGVGMVSHKQGAEWISLLSRGVNVTVDIVDPISAATYLSSSLNAESGGFISSFTSWGPTFEMDLKPQFAAPGGSILSTYPLDQGGYAVASGTSMAAPLTAAIYALVGQVRGTFDPATIESLLSATANPKLFHSSEGVHPYLAPPAQQGAGLVQAYDAARSTTLLSVSSLSFNDTDHFVKSTNFTIKNLGTSEVTYTLSNIEAATAYTLDTGSSCKAWSPELSTEGASLSFSSDKITIPGGGQALVTVIPTAPTLDASRLPVFGGYIALNATNGDLLSLPYIGSAGSLFKSGIFREGDGAYIQTGFGIMVANESFVLPKTGEPDFSRPVPMPTISLCFDTRIVRIDVIPLDPGANTTDILGAQALGSMRNFPVLWNGQGAGGSIFDGRLADGSFVPEGRYSLLFRALKIFGDPEKPGDYEAVESLPFSISYTSS